MATLINPYLSGSGPAGSLLIDIPGMNVPAAAYSMARKLRAAYAGSCFRMRRSSDDAEQDIGFSGNNVDEAAMDAFAPAMDGYVVTWYDQSGSGLNLVQATNADQPHCWGGAIESLNSKLCFLTDGATEHMALSAASALLNFTEGSAMLLANGEASGNRMFVCDVTAPDIPLTGIDLTNLVAHSAVAEYGGGVYAYLTHNAPPATDANLQLVTMGNVAGEWAHRQNGVATGASVTNTPQAMSVVSRQIMVARNNGAYFGGRFQEILVWGNVLSTAQLEDLEVNTNTYYSIF